MILRDIRAVLESPADYEDTELCAYEKTAKVELVKKSEQDILRAHFSWVPEYNIYLFERSEAEKLTALEFRAAYTPESDSSKESWAFRLKSKKERHLWFMNFRRYGWAWTTEKDGEHGYIGGPVYANGTTIANLADTPAEVIRDALVAAWTELRLREHLPDVFFCREAEALVKILYKEALEHVSEHADPRRNNGRAVYYLPTMKIDMPEVKVEQPPRKAVYDWKRRNANESIFGL